MTNIMHYAIEKAALMLYRELLATEDRIAFHRLLERATVGSLQVLAMNVKNGYTAEVLAAMSSVLLACGTAHRVAAESTPHDAPFAAWRSAFIDAYHADIRDTLAACGMSQRDPATVQQSHETH